MDCICDSLELRWLRFRLVRRLKIRISHNHRLVFAGLGELTFLQLSTTYTPSSTAAHCIGYVGPRFIKQNIMLLIFISSYFASGTGAAGISGAFLWWEVRGLGVRVGVGVSSVRRLRVVPRRPLIHSCSS